MQLENGSILNFEGKWVQERGQAGGCSVEKSEKINGLTTGLEHNPQFMFDLGDTKEKFVFEKKEYRLRIHMFKLQKYNNVTEIIETYYGVRLNLYQERKNHMIIAFENELVLLSNKTKYIKEVLDGTIDLRKKKREEVTEMLAKKGFDKMDDDGDYKYLVKMPMDSVTEENVEKIMKDKAIKESELDKLKKTTINQMWLSELEKLKEQYIEYQEGRRRLCECLTVSKKSVKNASKPKTHIKKSK